MPNIQVKFKNGKIEADAQGFMGQACSAMDFLTNLFTLEQEDHKESYYAEVSGEETIENY
jgi:hypothetical protein